MKPFFNIKKILVPTDFSETAANALKQAINLAIASKAKLKIVHIVMPIYESPSESSNFWRDDFYKKIIKQSNGELKKIVSEIKQKNSISVEFEVKLGMIKDEICGMAKKGKFDIIVMGTHGTSGFKEFFVGSNAYKIVNHASCPVLTVQKKTVGKGFKNILLPIRLEKNSRQKVDYVVDTARLFDSSVLIAGFTSDKNQSQQLKLKQYVNQVDKYLSKLNIKHSTKLIVADNFTKEMIALAKKNKIDLIAVLKKYDFSIDQLTKGPYAEQFVDHSPIPVLSIPPVLNPELLTYTPYLSGGTGY